MRATPMLGVALVCVLASACGRTAPERTVSAGDRVLAPFTLEAVQAPQVARPQPSQPRLEALLDKRPTPPKPPAASFSRYDGRAPGDPIIPQGVVARAQQQAPATVVPTRNSVAQKLPEQGIVPSRDVVDLGLSPVRPARPAPPQRSAAPVALSKAPAPVPRPATQTPRPLPRPSIEVAAIPPAPVIPQQPVLPPAPRIQAFQAPSLRTPGAVQDATPTGLPSTQLVEGAVPLGRVPASLGIANLRASEAALPVADSLEKSAADPSGALGWDQAAALIRAGEVSTVDDIGQFEVLLTLCSGRGVISIQPTPDALKNVEIPKVVCGKAVSLTSQ